MEKVAVNLPGREYEIVVGSGLVEDLAGSVMGLEGCRKVVLVSHPALAKKHHPQLRELAQRLDAGERGLQQVLFPSGEQHKNLNTVNRIYRELLSLGMERSDALINWGGGVVGDLGGFVAASYMRGIRYIQVPTTLMAMVDSSIGGKVGVDLPNGKNLVGFFHQPAGVFCHTALLSTLPEREYVSGFGEVAKYALVFDPALHAWLLERSEALLQRREAELSRAISACAAIKSRLVEEDERDLYGRRILLNYGHTFAHALEVATGYRSLLHGEAVALGMRMAARLSEVLGVAGKTLYAEHAALLAALSLTGLGRRIPDPAGLYEEIVESMAFDKKREQGELRLVLLEEVGQPVTLRREPGPELAASIRTVLEEDGAAATEKEIGR